jgi:hypothetical protein
MEFNITITFLDNLIKFKFPISLYENIFPSNGNFIFKKALSKKLEEYFATYLFIKKGFPVLKSLSTKERLNNIWPKDLKKSFFFEIISFLFNI